MVQVKDSAAWTIGRVCEHCPEVLLNEEYLLVLLNTLMKALEGEPRVAVNVCWVCYTHPLSLVPFYMSVLSIRHFLRLPNLPMIKLVMEWRKKHQ